MSDTTPPGRPLTEPERLAFQRLGLTPGHWAALAPAPLFNRVGLRAPNRRTPSDLAATDRLRVALRTLEGLSNEAAHFWDRLGESTTKPEATIASRLLAWHLSTDLSFARRSEYFQILRQVAEHFAVRSPHVPRTPADAVHVFRWLVDAYLPHPTYVPDSDPPSVTIPPPTSTALDALASSIRSPLLIAWPALGPAEVPRRMPNLVSMMGEPVRDWWGTGDPSRRAVERGLAGMSYDARHRISTNVLSDWYRVLQNSQYWPHARDFAQQFVNRIWEWVDVVRRAARDRLPEEPPSTAVILVPPAAVPRKELPASQHLKTVANPKPERVTAVVATPFTMVSLDEALARAHAVTAAEVCSWVDAAHPLLFDDCRDELSREIAVVKTVAAVPPVLWVIGDIHADVLALANIITMAEAQATPERPPHFFFLGDFVDRGVHDHAALLLLFRLMMDHPGRVCVVPGNHDVDLQFDESTQRFRVTIDPAEYCETLNAAIQENAPNAAEQVVLARAFIRFCATRPKAVFLPDGTLFTHGGFPHIDAQKDIASLADLCNPRCLDDFLWARIAESARIKRPNRGSRGHEFGWDTLAQFAKLAGERLELPVRRFVRGHDHVPDRWQEYPEYADNGVPVLTLNAMGRLLDGESARRDGRPHPLPAVGRFISNHLPEVVLLPLDPVEVDRAFGRARPAGSAGALSGAVDELLLRIARGNRGAEGAP